mmetsp:Transcript_21166/g.43479  ORF Transcript_21166/g.43479 Transcript_21166/m.43479 type:complete len:416 (-) Transcript_21166:825-2072(-)
MRRALAGLRRRGGVSRLGPRHRPLGRGARGEALGVGDGPGVLSDRRGRDGSGARRRTRRGRIGRPVLGSGGGESGDERAGLRDRGRADGAVRVPDSGVCGKQRRAEAGVSSQGRFRGHGPVFGGLRLGRPRVSVDLRLDLRLDLVAVFPGTPQSRPRLRTPRHHPPTLLRSRQELRSHRIGISHPLPLHPRLPLFLGRQRQGPDAENARIRLHRLGGGRFGGAPQSRHGGVCGHVREVVERGREDGDGGGERRRNGTETGRNGRCERGKGKRRKTRKRLSNDGARRAIALRNLGQIVGIRRTGRLRHVGLRILGCQNRRYAGSHHDDGHGRVRFDSTTRRERRRRRGKRRREGERGDSPRWGIGPTFPDGVNDHGRDLRMRLPRVEECGSESRSEGGARRAGKQFHEDGTDHCPR